MIIATIDDLAHIDFTRNGGSGLVTVVAQHVVSGEVLMVAHASRDALEHTLREGVLWLYSRSRDALWRKGDTSGNTMRVIELHADCDRDAIVALVEPAGPACHTGSRSCFDATPTLAALADILADRADVPDGGGYTRRLLADANLRAKKLGEEAVELALASASGDRSAVAEEGADLLYHTFVACHAAGVSVTEVLRVLELRSGRGQ